MWVPQPALTRKPVKGEAPGWAAKLCKKMSESWEPVESSQATGTS